MRARGTAVTLFVGIALAAACRPDGKSPSLPDESSPDTRPTATGGTKTPAPKPSVSVLGSFTRAQGAPVSTFTASQKCKTGSPVPPFGTLLEGEDPVTFFLCLGDADDAPEALKLEPTGLRSGLGVAHYVGVLKVTSAAGASKVIAVTLTHDDASKMATFSCAGIGLSAAKTSFTLPKQGEATTWGPRTLVCEFGSLDLGISAGASGKLTDLEISYAGATQALQLAAFPTTTTEDPNAIGLISQLNKVDVPTLDLQGAQARCSSAPIPAFGTVLVSQSDKRTFVCTGDKDERADAIEATSPVDREGNQVRLAIFHYRKSPKQPYKTIVVQTAYSSVSRTVGTSCSALNRDGTQGVYTRLKQDTPDTWLENTELCQGLAVDDVAVRVKDKDTFDTFKLNVAGREFSLKAVTLGL